MNFIERIRLFFYTYFLNKKLHHHHRKHQPGNLQTARQVGILFDATDIETQRVIKKYITTLQDQGKVVRSLGFIRDKQKHENLSFPHFTKREIDWAWRPKSDAVTEFMQQPFDILLVLSYQSNLQFEYIAALSKAQMRVGPYTEQQHSYDLMLDAPKQSSLTKFIEQIELFLKKIHSSHEAPTT